MEKVRNDKKLPEQTEEFSHPDDWWLDEEDSADGLSVFDPDVAREFIISGFRLILLMVYQCLIRTRQKIMQRTDSV